MQLVAVGLLAFAFLLAGAAPLAAQESEAPEKLGRVKAQGPFRTRSVGTYEAGGTLGTSRLLNWIPAQRMAVRPVAGGETQWPVGRPSGR